MTNTMFEEFRQAQAENERLKAEAVVLERELKKFVKSSDYWVDGYDKSQVRVQTLETMVAVRDDLIAETAVALEQAQTRVTALEEVEAAARIIFDVAKMSGSWHGPDAIVCPHGNAPFYPAHGWWCDDCFFRLQAALAAPAREGDADARPGGYPSWDQNEAP